MDIREELKKKRKEAGEAVKTYKELDDEFRVGQCEFAVAAYDSVIELLKGKHLLILGPGEIGLRISDKEKALRLMRVVGDIRFDYEYNQLKAAIGGEDE